MSFPAYERYSDIHVDGLGPIPTHWGLSRLGYESWVRARLGWKGLKADEYVEDGYPLLATPDIKNREIDFDGANRITLERYDESPEIKIAPGDILLAKDGSTLGTVNIVRSLPRPATVNSSLAVITPDATCYGLFLFFYFQSSFVRSRIDQLKGGMGVPHLFQDDLNRFPLPLPPLPDQIAIAAFLDRETAKIDALVEAQRRLIELLKEKRQAVIFHAVTKGLDLSAPMKDSGVEWLGQVPAHWEVVPIKRLARLQSGEAITSTDIEATGSFPVYGGNGLRGFSERYTHDGDFVLIGRQGALCGNINYAQGTFWASEHAIVAHPLQAFSTRWFGELLRTMNLGQYSVAAAQPGLSADALGNLRCPCPSMDEQYGIANAIEEALSIFDPLIGEAESAIALLQERRAALISAAVTGKIDVRDVAVLTKEADAA
ncbi:restriction endonuclease subunit S [Phenylobacterium sp. LjRoot164]|uniref:restriction endonuclease subunit S n=1 Tax=unclassified Phenylobacterium TaxID=2640670 RepID=UPI003ED05E76